MKKIFIIGLFLLAAVNPSAAQTEIDAAFTRLELLGHTGVSALKTNQEASLEDMLHSENWKPYDSSFTTTPATVVWLKFQLQNTTRNKLNLYLFSNDNYNVLYQQHGEKYQHSQNGPLVSLQNRASKEDYAFTPIELSPSQQSWFYVKLRSRYQLINPNYPALVSRLNYLNFINAVRNYEARSIGFMYTYLISLCCIFTFVLIFCFRLQKQVYFYYLGYLFFQIVYAFLALGHTPATIMNLSLYVPDFSHLIFEPTQFSFIGFYIFFILHLLEIKRFDQQLSKVLRGFGLFCFIYALLRFGFNYFWRDLEAGELIFTIVRMIVLPLNLILFFRIIAKAKHPLLKYFIFGQSFFFIGSVLSSVISYTEVFLIPGNIFNFPHSQNIIFQAGLLAEVFCFSIALGENVFLIQQEKDNASRKLIEQLQHNQVLEENMRKELDKKINEKTEELIQLYSEIEKQKEAQIRKSFSERLRNMKMLALRSQMNPHFIFNSLNALKNLVMMSREEDAIDYLDNFSVLLRTILQNSSKNIISVETELEMLELYLSLEKRRLGENFSYTIRYDSREALSQYTIPPLLLQPFVENAIWHGLQPSPKAEKVLCVSFDTTRQLQIEIEDNGVGREESGKRKKLHQSVGTNITKERLSLYNHISNAQMQMNIVDLNDNGIPAGTRITITYNE